MRLLLGTGSQCVGILADLDHKEYLPVIWKTKTLGYLINKHFVY